MNKAINSYLSTKSKIGEDHLREALRKNFDPEIIIYNANDKRQLASFLDLLHPTFFEDIVTGYKNMINTNDSKIAKLQLAGVALTNNQINFAVSIFRSEL